MAGGLRKKKTANIEFRTQITIWHKLISQIFGVLGALKKSFENRCEAPKDLDFLSLISLKYFVFCTQYEREKVHFCAYFKGIHVTYEKNEV